MARKLTNNNAHFKRAVKKLPLGVASNFRYWGEERTIYVKRGKGARIVDLDDNQYVDYRMGYGPGILGYADDRVDAAARAGMEVGGVFALSTEYELKVAERISKMVPAAELVVHDATRPDPAYAFALSRLDSGDFSHTPIGIFRSVERPSYDDLMAGQIATARAGGEGDLATLLSGNDTWEVR